MSYEIYTDIPLPPVSSSKEKYPFSKLGVGDCFFVDGGVTGRRVRNSVAAKNKNTIRRFVARQIADGRVGVWRVA